MRRMGLMVLVLAGASCQVLRDASRAHPAVAARAAGQSLSVERLAELASRVRGMPLEPATLGRVAAAYVDYTLFAMSLAHGQNLDDSVLVVNAMWPLVAQLRFDHFAERLHAGTALSAAQIDSTYAAGAVRAFQHILVSIPAGAAPAVVQQKQAEINRLWRALARTGGTDFATVAKRSSEDPGSKVAGGYLDAGGRGRFVPPFEDAAWRLSPGAMSGVVRSMYGFHVIRRPPLAEIRDTFAADVRRILASRADSIYFADLARRRRAHVATGAAAEIRAALKDPQAASLSPTRLASYDGGDFTTKDLVRWLYSLDPGYARQLVMGTDSQIGALVQQMVERKSALQEAESAKVQLADSEWAAIRAEYHSTLAILRMQLQLDTAMLRDSGGGGTPDGRARFAMARVNDYFDRALGGQARFRPVPPLLASALRERAQWSVNQAGIRAATERAIALRASADSSRPAGTGGSGTGLRRAPGPPPLEAGADSARPRAPTRQARP